MTKTPYLAHYVFELLEVPKEIFNSRSNFEKKLQKFIQKLNLKILNSFHHQFEPFGQTFIFILSESHLAIHTWPEYSYLHFDLVSCSKKTKLIKAKEILKELFLPQKIKIRHLSY